ncbi:hypothetical protein MMC07_009835 [Pseudocyphellaria aurata]|nr:hypothetical protein [Pseudocyphellaria aurata]
MPANRNRSASPAGSAPTGSAVPVARRSRLRRANPIGPPPRLSSTRISRGQNRRNMVDDTDHQAGANDAFIALREAQQEEACLRKEAEQAAEEEEDRARRDAKLVATLARVEELKAQKVERDARWGATTLSVIGGPQSQTASGSTS